MLLRSLIVALVASAPSDEVLEGARAIVDEVIEAKKEVDKVRKSYEAAAKEIDAARSVVDAQARGLDEVARSIDEAAGRVLSEIGTAGSLVVFMQRCEGGGCLEQALPRGEQMKTLLETTATEQVVALASRVEALVTENAELVTAVEAAREARSTAEDRLADEIYRLAKDVEQHEREQKRLRDADKRRNDERSREDAEKALLVTQVKELAHRQAFECDVVTDHNHETVLADMLVIVRIYDPPKHPGKLWWALAEVESVVNGDGTDPDSLVQVRLFRDYIKSASRFALDATFDRDLSKEGLVQVRRDAVAYLNVTLNGAGDPKKAAARFGRPIGGQASSSSDDDDDRRFGRPASKHKKKPSGSQQKKRFGVEISELEKRGIVARLERDEVTWERRDRLDDQVGREINVGDAVAWQIETDSGIEFRLGKVVDLDDHPKNSTSFTVTLFAPNLTYPLNVTALDDRFADNQTLDTVNRSDIVYAGIPIHGSRRKTNETETFTLKSSDKKLVSLLLKQATARWWRRLADNFDPPPQPQTSPPDTKRTRRDDWDRRPKRTPAPNVSDAPHIPLDDPTPAASEPANLSLATPEQVAAAEQSEKDRWRADGIARSFATTVDASLDALKRKLLWLVEVGDLGLISAEESASLRANVLSNFDQVTPGVRGQTEIPFENLLETS